MSHLTAWTESAAWPRSVYPDHDHGQDTAIFAKALEGTGMDVRLRDWYAK